MNDSSQLIVGCMTGAAVVAAGSAVADGDAPDGRMVIGFAFSTLGIAVLGMFAPRLAGGLAVLVLTTSVFTYGTPLLDAVTTRTSSTTSTRTRKVVSA